VASLQTRPTPAVCVVAKRFCTCLPHLMLPRSVGQRPNVEATPCCLVLEWAEVLDGIAPL
jgi:hypothetical protein